ncbi:hypothetical protein AAHH78_43560, partial [Burkholderia pseudomallei]
PRARRGDSTLAAWLDETGATGATAAPRWLAAWCEQGKVAKIAAHWAHGVNVDWRRLYGSRAPVRVSLPTYPVAPER